MWKDKAKPEEDPEHLIHTYTIITTTATGSVGRIHDRMPRAIAPAHWEAWLDPCNHDVDELQALMAPSLDGALEMYAVSTAVNSVRNKGPERLEPLAVS